MRRQLQHQLWIAAAAAIVFFVNLGAAGLWDEDEPLYASCAREMLQRGDWVVPMYNGEMFPDKPPLMFWIMMAGFKTFGINELGARFFSAVIGVATALATYHLGRRLFCAQVGLWAGLITATTIIFTISARAATVDSALVFVTTTAFLLFAIVKTGKQRVSGEIGNPGDGEGSADEIPPDAAWLRPYLPQSWWVFVLIYALMGLAVLAKGPIGLLLPAAIIGLFLLIANHLNASDAGAAGSRRGGWAGRVAGLLAPFGPRKFLRAVWQMRPITGVLVVAAVTFPWYILVGLRTDGLWLEQFFAKFNLRPFVQPILGHSGPFWYHVPSILIGFFPWAVFMGPTLVHTVRRIRRRDDGQPGYVLLVCWIGVFFVFWSICSTKLPHYVLPCYPALALLTACFLHHWMAEPAQVSRRWLWAETAVLTVVGVGAMVAVPVATSIYVPGEEWLGLVVLILVAGGGLFCYFARADRLDRALASFAVMSVAFLTAVFGVATLRVDRYQNARPMIAAVRGDQDGPAQLAALGFIRESTVFYAGQTVPIYQDARELAASLDDATAAYVFTTDRHEEQLQQQCPGQFEVLLRRPRFLASGEEVVLTRRAHPNMAQTAERSSSSPLLR